jgi:hypothetical protein
MNYYSILELSDTATDQDIKNSYRRLVKIHHPDKSKDVNSTKIIQDINIAYDILSDPVKKKEYDNLTSNNKLMLYDLITDYLTKINPDYYIFLQRLVTTYYGDELDFKHHINNFDFNNIIKSCDNSGIPVYHKNIMKQNIKDVYLEVDIYDLILGYKKINNEYELDLTDHPDYIIKNNIRFNIIYKDHDIYKRLKHDIITYYPTSLYNYLYGGDINLDLFGDNIKISYGSQIEREPLFIINNRGLLKKNNSRGDLYIILQINNIYDENMKESIQKLG